jgi:galactofuranosylgalactofuranosylrhamnosyl-N-acetylglucosaminyl-diphospho-decaprenol beta-1,5/1,6-galactofuranosyltransferase
MNIVGRIRFPHTNDVSDLYIKCYEGVSINYCEGCREVNLIKGGIVSLNSYFNSFYEKFYAKYTELCSLHYLLKLQGDFQISLYREIYGRENRELIYIERFEKCKVSDCIKILLPKLSPNGSMGRVYLEIICLSEYGLFTEGLVVTEQNKLREVSLGIITCTFRKEAYVKNTIDTILKDSLLEGKSFKIFVIDNGRTLKKSDYNFQNVQLFFNKNVGGSGGFTRGLIEALSEGIYTHFLFMDDDIELDTESIYRLFSLYEYAKRDFAVAGSMLDLRNKYTLYEAGALYSKHPDRSGYYPFVFAPLKHNLPLQDTTSLNLLLKEENLDYGAFWFFSVSKEIIKRVGMLMPFFIKLDDVEFSLRIKEFLGSEIVVFPSIAVWHEPFYAKVNAWEAYYIVRNSLITNSIRKRSKYLQTFKHLTKLLVTSLLYFDYNSVEMIVKAFEDYMKGPAFIQNSDPGILHSSVLELSQHYKSQTLPCNNYSLEKFYQKSRIGSFNKLFRFITLNGHLLPSFVTSNNEAFVLFSAGHYGQWHKPFAKKKVIIFREPNSCFYQNEIDKLAGIKLLIRWFKVAITSSIKWSIVSAEWKTASRDLASIEFWQQYLGLKNPSSLKRYL